MATKEKRYESAVAEDAYTKGASTPSEDSDFAVVKGPSGNRFPIPRTGESDEQWHEKVKQWQDEGVLVDWKGPLAEKFKTPEAKVVGVEDAQPEGERAFREANAKIIEEREKKATAEALGTGVEAQKAALRKKGIPYFVTPDNVVVPRAPGTSDAAWQAARDEVINKTGSGVPFWDGPDKEPDKDSDDRVAGGGGFFGQVKKGLSALVNNAAPDGGTPSFQQGLQQGQAFTQSLGGAGGGGGTEGSSGGGPGGAATGYDHRPADMGAAVNGAYETAGELARYTNPIVNMALNGPFRDPGSPSPAVAPLSPDAVPPAMPPSRPGISEEVPGVAAAAPKAGKAAAGMGAQGPMSTEQFGKQLEDLGKQADMANKVSADIESQKLRRLADLQLDAQKEALVAQQQMESINQARLQHQDDAIAAYNQTQADIRAPAEIDPDHYWKVRDTSQKIASVLGAFFSGGATLASMHAAINRDVAAQQASINNRASFNKEKLAAQGNYYLMARQNGLDALQAKALTIDSIWGNVEQTSKAIAMQSGSDAVKQQAAAAIAEAGQQRVKARQMFDHQTQLLGLEKEKNQIDWAKLNLMRQRGEGVGGGKALPGIIQNRISNARDGLNKVQQILTVLGPESSVPEALWDEVTKGVPTTAANRKSKGVEILKRSLARAIDNSAIQKADAEYYKDKLGGVGFANLTQDDLKGLARMFAQEAQTAYETSSVAAPRPQQGGFLEE